MYSKHPLARVPFSRMCRRRVRRCRRTLAPRPSPRGEARAPPCGTRRVPGRRRRSRRVDADTDTENDRHAYQPQGRPRTPTLTGPYPIAPRQRGPPHTGERMPRPKDSSDLPKSPLPVMQRWVGGHHATAAVPPGLMTPEGSRGSKEGGGIRISNHLISPYLISDLPEIHMHACQRQHRRGYPPALRRPRAAPSWARPHSW